MVIPWNFSLLYFHLHLLRLLIIVKNQELTAVGQMSILAAFGGVRTFGGLPEHHSVSGDLSGQLVYPDLPLLDQILNSPLAISLLPRGNCQK